MMMSSPCAWIDVALTVRDRERSAAFYAEHFGLTERLHDDDDRLILGDAAGSVLALSAGIPPPGLPRKHHFGFGSTMETTSARRRERFRAAGVAEVEWQDDSLIVRVQVEDPDGYAVELTRSDSGSIRAMSLEMRPSCEHCGRRPRVGRRCDDLLA